MASFHESVMEYKKQLAKGAVKEAYRGLLEYMMALRTHFADQYPDDFVSGNIYFGYMDMTYFSIVPKSLKELKLKIALVFLHETCRFEVWLAGYNKKVQEKYWQRIKKSGWNRYRLVSSTKGADSILEHIAVEDPNFNNLGALTKQIEKTTVQFTKDVEDFLSRSV